jgi:hypothetical protein
MSHKFKLFAELYEKEQPHIWQACYPKTYEGIGNYFSPKYIGAALASTLYYYTASHKGLAPIDPNVDHAYIVTNFLIKYQVPLIFVTPELLAAAKNTSLPPDLKIEDLKLPFQAFVFVFENESIQSPLDGACNFIAISQQQKNIRYESNIAGLPDIGVTKNSINFFTNAENNENPLFAAQLPTEEQDAESWITENVNEVLIIPQLSQNLKTEHPDRNPQFIQSPTEHPDRNPQFIQSPTEHTHGIAQLNSQDQQFLKDLRRIIIKLCLIIQARPNLISYGQKLKTVKNKKNNKITEYWTPNILGRNYQRKQEQENSVETNTSPRLHWRRGHLRQQPHGPLNSLRKTIWIEPILIGN